MTVDDYLRELPEERRAVLEELRSIIRAVLPEATETISYGIPTFKVNNRPVVYIAAFKHHYSLYPATDGVVAALGAELEPYLAGRGTIRFPARDPVPGALVEKVVRIRMKESEAESSAGTDR